ncbi:DUF1697 domain-containing protein [Rathayibacter tanaceti]|uniref:DUF1697 domain-containing protein n=2 Tax=Rathayibacter tanaceti TaxID=1671680 RepID=A0A162GQY4_9MICO|nr:DUF1697 domain-containing protein [Rathayibacter tanaceti]KZX21368.1 hypothetical protein ACH61_01510 [Rathayibacter tanaceti]QHC54382.1 DUF1697 domain-containing protein [Rathayibacter tanaceti]TCO38065.1 uncharacterized protein (DUF1697 family) [Rathayibacter tanaceti]
MTRYLALLRGVNVNGRTVRSAELAETVAGVGGERVRTVLASGNAAFDSDRSAAALKPALEAALAERFGYDAWIVLVTQEALAAVLAAYPFPRIDAEAHPYVVFGSDEEALDAAQAAIGETDPAVELVARGADVLRGTDVLYGADVLYWRCPRGSSTDTPVAKVLARSAYRSTTTTRNLRTVEKLATA